jgi:hypothetical protein
MTRLLKALMAIVQAGCCSAVHQLLAGQGVKALCCSPVVWVVCAAWLYLQTATEQAARQQNQS